MFGRRKKSIIDVARGRTGISISSPMPMSAQAQASAVPATFYDRFAATTTSPNPKGGPTLGVDATRGVGAGRMNGNGEGNEYAKEPSNVPLRHKMNIGGNRDGEIVGRNGWMGGHIGTGTAFTEDVSRMPQQLSPPTSPTFPKRSATREMSEPAPMLQRKSSRENMHMWTETRNGVSRLPTPPSPPPQLPVAKRNAAPAIVIPDLNSSLPATPILPTPQSHLYARSTNASASPALDGSGRLLSNSLETRRVPRRGKYSPLAAFGPSTPSSPSPEAKITPAYTQSITIASSDRIPDTIGFGSGSGSGSVLGGSARSPAHSDLQPDRPSLDVSFEADRHTSIQPLKSHSIELRVGYNADEQTFYSPLFASASGGDDANRALANRKTGAARFSGDVPSNSDSNRDAASRDSDDLKAKVKSGRTARALPTPPTPPSPPSQSVNFSAKRAFEQAVPDAYRTRLNMDDDASRGRQKLDRGNERERSQSRAPTVSMSSAGSVRRRTEHEEQVPDLPIDFSHQTQDREALLAMEAQDARQTPRRRSQIPTPPTSVDGHSGNSTMQPRQMTHMTIASVFDTERSPEQASASSSSYTDTEPHRIDGHRVRKSSSAKRINVYARVNAESTTPDAPLSTNGRSLTADAIAGNLNGLTASFSREAGASGSGTFIPAVDTANLPRAPLSPPQSPPQPAVLIPYRSHARSKSRTRRPDTADSYASSSDGGLHHSPSALSALMTFTRANGNGTASPIPRKLTKPNPVSAPSHGAAERQTVLDPVTDADMLVDADPFAKGEIVRTPPATANSAASINSMVVPIPPFAQTQGSAPPSPSSPEDYSSPRTRRRGERLDKRPREVAEVLARVGKANESEVLDTTITESEEIDAEPEPEPVPEPEPTFYPLDRHLMHPTLFAALLPYLVFRDWCALTAVNDALRRAIEHRRELREIVLEHFLGIVGYVRWKTGEKEPIMLTFRDLNSYMRGVSVPSHQFAVSAKWWLDIKHRQQHQQFPDEETRAELKSATVQKSLHASACRAYTRVVLRLREQAEAEEKETEEDEPFHQLSPPQSTTSVNAKAHARSFRARSGSRARAASRPPSPTSSISHSIFSHSQHGHGTAASQSAYGYGYGYAHERGAPPRPAPRFRSPLFRLGHAPCLRVFVPSPEGVWLSDQSVVECEKELKRAGVLPLLRIGDVVWDAAVGDEGNIGRMVWDGNYLLDLDYTYSRTGEAPKYLHTLSFPPSYFHRVIRTSGNPICYVDLSPWGEEIAANLQLLQDRIKTETPQGGHHTVVRWIHRSKFDIRPKPYNNAPIPILDTNLFIDQGWYGSIIVETEGTNEGLADLQDRCKYGFPPRAGVNQNAKNVSGRVFRLLRERSRPGEIWLRAVREKERLL